MSKEIKNRLVGWEDVVAKLFEVLENEDSPEPIQDIANLLLDGNLQYHEDGLFLYEPDADGAGEQNFTGCQETELTIAEIMGEIPSKETYQGKFKAGERVYIKEEVLSEYGGEYAGTEFSVLTVTAGRTYAYYQIWSHALEAEFYDVGEDEIETR